MQEETKALILAAQAGDKKAQKQLLQDNDNLVKKIASQFKNHSLDIEDVLQEGRIALLRSILKFDVNKGFAFSSYAYPAIQCALKKAIENGGSTIRLPSNYRSRAKAIRDKIALHNTDDLEELSRLTGHRVDTLEAVLNPKHRCKSLDKAVTEGGSSLEYFLAAPLIEEDSVENEKVHNAIAKLRPQQQRVIVLHYWSGMNLAEVGKHLGISRQRASQLHSQAKEKLSKVLK